MVSLFPCLSSVCLLSLVLSFFLFSLSFSFLFSLSSLLFAQVQRESIYVGRCKGRADKGGYRWGDMADERGRN